MLIIILSVQKVLGLLLKRKIEKIKKKIFFINLDVLHSLI